MAAYNNKKASSMNNAPLNRQQSQNQNYRQYPGVNNANFPNEAAYRIQANHGFPGYNAPANNKFAPKGRLEYSQSRQRYSAQNGHPPLNYPQIRQASRRTVNTNYAFDSYNSNVPQNLQTRQNQGSYRRESNHKSASGYQPMYAQQRAGYNTEYPQRATFGGVSSSYAQRPSHRGSTKGSNPEDHYGKAPNARQNPRQRTPSKADIARQVQKERALQEKRRRLKQKLKEENRMRRKKARKIFYGRTLVFFVVFFILSLAVSGFFFMRFISAPDKINENSEIIYTMGGKEVRREPYSKAFKNGIMYICFSDIADYLGLSITGNADGMKFVFPSGNQTDSAGDGTEDYLTFLIDNRTVIINSQSLTLPSDNFLYGEEVWVSADFISQYINGLSFEYNESKNRVAVSRIVDEEASDEKNTKYIPVSLKLKEANTLPAIAAPEEPLNNIKFTEDLSEYEQYMNPENADEYLILVNSENTLDGGYTPDDLTNISNTRNDNRNIQQMRLCAAKALDALFIEMKAAGFTDVSVTSAYRSYEYQNTLFEQYTANEMASNPALTKEEAEAIVVTYSSRPGTSEHQSGLCADMHNLSQASVEFANEEAYEWLCENAWKFGFILRYPEAKTDVTRISYEPWHWRFVGRKNAKAILDSSMCLEEYIASLGN